MTLRRLHAHLAHRLWILLPPGLKILSALSSLSGGCSRGPVDRQKGKEDKAKILETRSRLLLSTPSSSSRLHVTAGRGAWNSRAWTGVETGGPGGDNSRLGGYAPVFDRQSLP